MVPPRDLFDANGVRVGEIGEGLTSGFISYEELEQPRSYADHRARKEHDRILEWNTSGQGPVYR